MTAVKSGDLSGLSATQVDVLIVDDNELDRVLIRKTLEQDGYNVAEVDNVATGLGFAPAISPRLIILDLVLPAGGSGFDFLMARKKNVELKPLLSGLNPKIQTAFGEWVDSGKFLEDYLKA